MMKKIITSFLILLLIFCCKKEASKINSKKENSQATFLLEDKSFNGLGDILISQENYVNSIEDTCPNDYTENCFLKKLTFNPDDFKNRTLFIKDNISLKINKIIDKNESNGTINIKINLISKNQKILLYERFYEEYTVSFKNFYIDPNFNLWILDYFIDDEGVFLNYWKKYEINESNGEIKLVKDLIKQRYGYTVGKTVFPQVETYLNVRSQPSTDSEIVAKAYPQDSLTIIEILENNWSKVQFKDKIGYVSNDFIGNGLE